MIFRPTPAQEMRFRVDLVVRNSQKKNELNEVEPAYRVIGKAWAKVMPIQAKELLENAQNTMDLTHEIRCRYRSELTHCDAVLFRGRTLEIVSIIDMEEQHVELQLMCHEQK